LALWATRLANPYVNECCSFRNSIISLCLAKFCFPTISIHCSKVLPVFLCRFSIMVCVALSILPFLTVLQFTSLVSGSLPVFLQLCAKNMRFCCFLQHTGLYITYLFFSKTF